MERTRNELSAKSKYWISKHRYLELKHFCLQYPEWKRKYRQIDMLPPSDGFVRVNSNQSGGFFVEYAALRRTDILQRMELVEKIANQTDDYLGPFIFSAVTEGQSYTQLRSRGMACGKDMFYDRYHKFFWLLDQAR